MSINFNEEDFDHVKIAVIDFDGTIVKHRFPDIGEPLTEAFEVMKDLQKAGWILILWTCREDPSDELRQEFQFLTNAVEFCKKNGVEFDSVNETPLDLEFRTGDTLRRKVYGNVYIDDRNLGGFPGWEEVRKRLL